jgi:sugar lactone lactonase YvrE
VAADAENRVWACERGSGRVIRLSPELKWELAFKAPSTDLTGIAVDSQGRVLVASFTNKVYIFDAEGTLLKEMTGDAKQPLITAYRLCVDEKDNLYVLDAGRGHSKDPDVKAYDKNGKALGEWMARGLPFNEFSCIAWEPKGFVVLNNNGLKAGESQGIQLYAPNGKLKGRVMASNTNMNMMSVPGLAIGPRGDWVLDTTPYGRGCDRFTLMTKPVK